MRLLLRQPLLYLAVCGLIALVLLLRVFVRAAPDPAQGTFIDRPASGLLAGSGIIEAANDNTAIGVPSSGLVTALHVAVGDRVSAGFPLLTLDARPLQAQILTQEADVAVAEAILAKQEVQLRPRRRLFEQQLLSSDEWNVAESDTRIARAQLAAAQARVSQTRELIRQLTVTAPHDAAVLQVNVRVGEFATIASSKPAILVGEIRTLQVRASFDEQLASRVVAGRNATGRVKGDTAGPLMLRFVRVEPCMIPKQSLTGASAERVDTRVLQVIFRLEQPADRQLYVGQQMDVYFEEPPAPAAQASD